MKGKGWRRRRVPRDQSDCGRGEATLITPDGYRIALLLMFECSEGECGTDVLTDAHRREIRTFADAAGDEATEVMRAVARLIMPAIAQRLIMGEDIEGYDVDRLTGEMARFEAETAGKVAQLVNKGRGDP